MGAAHAAEDLALDPVDRFVEDAPELAHRVLADRLGLLGDIAQLPGELPGDFLHVAVGVRIAPAVRPALTVPASPAGPLAPVSAAPSPVPAIPAPAAAVPGEPVVLAAVIPGEPVVLAGAPPGLAHALAAAFGRPAAG